MLVLSRKKGESIVIQDNITITVLSVDGDNVRIGVSAPRDIDIFRKEVYEVILQNNQNALVKPADMEDIMLQIDKMKRS
ncbi:carbon storage regulator CsrA [Paenibacillus sp. Marseille-P2973]|uniref:carbon storage regulator CsrA n=1 Tax=Paenibacillus sp. Marseille-P2973 TaxID=1871032 RepID=UPI001B358CF7|nr:carbon storage regulator CsrA [Paenibacillus sp. Marseille-P2973]MBQ4900020.1 carbon storage regulator CsrA [Paenibacillus sp. Marseille-P2973]